VKKTVFVSCDKKSEMSDEEEKNGIKPSLRCSRRPSEKMEFVVRRNVVNPQVGLFVTIGQSEQDSSRSLVYSLTSQQFFRLETAFLRLCKPDHTYEFSQYIQESVVSGYRTANHVFKFGPDRIRESMGLTMSLLADCHSLVAQIADEDFQLEEVCDEECCTCHTNVNVFDGMCPSCEVLFDKKLVEFAGDAEMSLRNAFQLAGKFVMDCDDM
jgi:hypothetical protein